ncbi:hypothetical protein, partial [Enterococcus cecorum]|uniref:hypothetical protein n=1 Tax=Enterococcus cecorum TaxID=44008 RepID=UPI001FACF257
AEGRRRGGEEKGKKEGGERKREGGEREVEEGGGVVLWLGGRGEGYGDTLDLHRRRSRQRKRGIRDRYSNLKETRKVYVI